MNIEMDMTVRVLPGGKSYPDSVAIQRGPQILAAEDSLNPENITVSRSLSARVAVAAARRMERFPGLQSRIGVTLVPFADAVSMKVWLPAR